MLTNNELKMYSIIPGYTPQIGAKSNRINLVN